MVNAHNDWDPLEEVIVGRVDNACIPALTAEVKACTHETQWDYFRKYGGQRYPEELIKNISAEVDIFCDVLRQEGVIVRQPDIVDHTKVRNCRVCFAYFFLFFFCCRLFLLPMILFW